MSAQQSFDERYMRYAIALAARGLGRTMPNPSVGAVVVKNNQIVGVGHTAAGGRPHAETQALAMAGAHAKDATLYVTLEPCSHQGQTPPCVEAIIEAGIARVVVGVSDPNPKVNGAGMAALKAAGIAVIEGVCAAEVAAQLEGFTRNITAQMPYVTMKLATSLDGAVANANGESKWITGEAARTHAHGLRASHDAILTGIGTVLADDPMLTCRLAGCEGHSPIRVVADSQLRIALDTQLVKTANDIPLWILCGTHALTTQTEKVKALKNAGANILPIAMHEDDHLDMHAALATLAKLGVMRVMVEAGPALNSALLTQNLVDEIHWYRAAKLLGRGAKLALTPAISASLESKNLFTLTRQTRIGEDSLEVYKR